MKRNPRRSDRTAIEILKAPAKAASGEAWSQRHDAAIRTPRGIERGVGAGVADHAQDL